MEQSSFIVTVLFGQEGLIDVLDIECAKIC